MNYKISLALFGKEGNFSLFKGRLRGISERKC
jgi:hypothetical protein